MNTSADDRAWTCPSCARRWTPDRQALGRVARAADSLVALRRLVLLAVVLTLAVAAGLVVVHPQLILGVPVLVGGVLLALQPTYRKRRARAVAGLRGGIPLRRSETSL